MQSTAEFPLTRVDLIAFLRLRGAWLFYQAKDPRSCPIALAIKWHQKIGPALVQAGGRITQIWESTYGAPSAEYRNPEWVVDFMYRVDKHVGMLSAAEVLALL